MQWKYCAKGTELLVIFLTSHTVLECRSEHPNQERCEAVQNVSLWVRLSCRQAHQLKWTWFACGFQMLSNTQELMLELNYRAVGFRVEDVLLYYSLLPVEDTSASPLITSPELSPLDWCWGNCRWIELGCSCSPRPLGRVYGCNSEGTSPAGSVLGHSAGSVHCLGHRRTGKDWSLQSFPFSAKTGK